MHPATMMTSTSLRLSIRPNGHGPTTSGASLLRAYLCILAIAAQAYYFHFPDSVRPPAHFGSSLALHAGFGSTGSSRCETALGFCKTNDPLLSVSPWSQPATSNQCCKNTAFPG